MKKKNEKPVPFMVRLYKRHKTIIRKLKVGDNRNASDAEIVRKSLEFFAEPHVLRKL